MNYTISSTTLPGLLRITRPLQQQSQDSFGDIAPLDELNKLTGQNFQTRQINHSRSVKGVIRGLHAERWDKLVWVVKGQAYSAIVDLRPDSPTFGKYESFEMSGDNGLVLYIPEGFANSICALEDTDYMYMVTKTYDGSDTTAVAWDDPDIAVPWPVDNPIISKRDRSNPRLRELYPDLFVSR